MSDNYSGGLIPFDGCDSGWYYKEYSGASGIYAQLFRVSIARITCCPHNMRVRVRGVTSSGTPTWQSSSTFGSTSVYGLLSDHTFGGDLYGDITIRVEISGTTCGAVQGSPCLGNPDVLMDFKMCLEYRSATNGPWTSL